MTKINSKDLRKFWRRAHHVFGDDNETVYHFLTDNFPRPGKPETRLHDLTKREFYDALTLVGQMQMRGSKLTSNMYDRLFWLTFSITNDATKVSAYLLKVCQDKAKTDFPMQMDGRQYRVVCEALKNALAYRKKKNAEHV